MTAGHISACVTPWEKSDNKIIQNQLSSDMVDNTEWLPNQIELILF